MKPTLDLFPQDLKVLISVIVVFRVSTQLFLPIISHNLSKIKNPINRNYASLQGFEGKSPRVDVAIHSTPGGEFHLRAQEWLLRPIKQPPQPHWIA